ncbi:hypothetical protein ACYSNR_14990 [Enterococcus sp. LJL128]
MKGKELLALEKKISDKEKMKRKEEKRKRVEKLMNDEQFYISLIDKSVFQRIIQQFIYRKIGTLLFVAFFALIPVVLQMDGILVKTFISFVLFYSALACLLSVVIVLSDKNVRYELRKIYKSLEEETNDS